MSTLDLPLTVAEIPDDAVLFAPAVAGGLDLDSLAALEILVGLGREFGLQLDEIPRESFMSVEALAAFVESRL